MVQKKGSVEGVYRIVLQKGSGGHGLLEGSTEGVYRTVVIEWFYRSGLENSCRMVL